MADYCPPRGALGGGWVDVDQLVGVAEIASRLGLKQERTVHSWHRGMRTSTGPISVLAGRGALAFEATRPPAPPPSPKSRPDVTTTRSREILGADGTSLPMERNGLSLFELLVMAGASIAVALRGVVWARGWAAVALSGGRLNGSFSEALAAALELPSHLADPCSPGRRMRAADAAEGLYRRVDAAYEATSSFASPKLSRKASLPESPREATLRGRREW